MMKRIVWFVISAAQLAAWICVAALFARFAVQLWKGDMQ